MPTQRQKKVAKLIIENSTVDKPLTGGQMLAKVGYSESMQTAKVNDVLESEGVKEALADYGFTEDNAKQVVASILLDENKDPNSRLKASDMIFKVHGTYAPEKNINLNIDAEPSKEVKELTKKLNDIHRGTSIASNGRSASTLDTETPDKE